MWEIFHQSGEKMTLVASLTSLAVFLGSPLNTRSVASTEGDLKKIVENNSTDVHQTGLNRTAWWKRVLNAPSSLLSTQGVLGTPTGTPSLLSDHLPAKVAAPSRAI